MTAFTTWFIDKIAAKITGKRLAPLPWLLLLVSALGIAFSQSASASLTPLYSFSTVDSNQANTDGANPAGALLLGRDGALYGTTFDGGAEGAGTLFRQGTPGTGHTVLHVFSAATDGSAPMGTLMTGADGRLYGTTSSGGPLGGGTVFAMAADGSGFTVLYSFAGDSGSGGYPAAGMTDGGDGFLYGTTTGGVLGTGVAYRLAPNGSGFTVLHTFTGSEEPLCGLVSGGDGFFYGTTFYGGDSGVGTVYKISPDGTTFAVLYSFTGVGDGGYPQAALTVGSGGFLYGTTSDSQLTDGYGTVFKIKTDGTAFATLYNFGGGSDGGTPLAPVLLGPGGVLSGTTFSGGDNGAGTIFQINTDGSAFLTLAAFPGSGLVGGGPSAGLTLGADGALYGTASEGGSLSTLLTGDATDPNATDPNAADPNAPVTPAAPTFTGSVFRLVSSRHTDLLWMHTSGMASVWSIRANGSGTVQVYGPYAGWKAVALAEGPDGNDRLLWTNTDGRTALWNLGDANPAATCPVYGPYTGWTATALSVGPDNAAHLLWDHTSGAIALWNLTDVNPAATCPVYGPYTGWSGTSIGFGADNHERLLWNNVNGTAAVWNLADPAPATNCLVAGPYTGWTATALSVGPDNAAHLLWDHTSGATALWNLTDVDPAATCAVYGPYTGWSGTAISVGADSAVHLLWDNASGQLSFWNLGDANPAATCLVAGPYTGWSGVAIAAGQ